MKLKKISEQTIVITGATSGIGLVTARMAAEQGANLVLIARNEDALRELSDEINNNGGKAIYFAADVADENALYQAAETAISELGGFDTWVNDAGVSVFGRILEVPTDDLRRVIETNLWGVIYGSRVAAQHLKRQGGAIINVGSELSDRAIPLQGIYTASKHAVKAFTDTLRMELEADKFPVSVTLIKPGAIGTPYNDNAKNYLPYEPKGPQPVFAPELVAEAILHCAATPTRDMFVGESAKLNSLLGGVAPRLTDYMMERSIDSSQNSGKPRRANRRDGLYESNSNLRERDPKYKVMFEESPMQRLYLNRLVTGALLGGAAIGLALYLNSKNKSSDDYSVLTGDSAPPKIFPIKEHQEVIGSDGHHVGIVDKVEGDRIKLTKTDVMSGGKHHEISLNLVAKVEQDKVLLNQTAAQARLQWQTDDNEATGNSAGRGATSGY